MGPLATVPAGVWARSCTSGLKLRRRKSGTPTVCFVAHLCTPVLAVLVFDASAAVMLVGDVVVLEMDDLNKQDAVISGDPLAQFRTEKKSKALVKA